MSNIIGRILSRVARTQDGLDIIIRVIVIRDEGHNHLNILRTIATGENCLLSTNHTLPMFMEFQFEDIFPRVGGEMLYALGFWPDNSVGDIIDMLLQMLEVSFTYVVSQFSFIHLFKIKDT